MKLTVRVPASSANLGPGFDILAIALQLQYSVVAEDAPGDRIVIDDAEDASHLLRTTYESTCNALSVPPARRGICMTTSSEIPKARGMGSSAAVTLAGVLIAAGIHGATWNERRVIAQASEIEGHPDNVAAALMGGMTICAPDMPAQRIDLPPDLNAVLFIPDFELKTHEARAVVPASFSREDAIYNAAHVAMIIRALCCHDYTTLIAAMRDRWHQPQRTTLMPWLPAMIDAANAADAAAALSGAGPTVIALTDHDPNALQASLRSAAHDNGIDGEVRVVGLRNYGTRVDVSA